MEKLINDLNGVLGRIYRLQQSANVLNETTINNLLEIMKAQDEELVSQRTEIEKLKKELDEEKKKTN